MILVRIRRDDDHNDSRFYNKKCSAPIKICNDYDKNYFPKRLQGEIKPFNFGWSISSIKEETNEYSLLLTTSLVSPGFPASSV